MEKNLIKCLTERIDEQETSKYANKKYVVGAGYFKFVAKAQNTIPVSEEDYYQLVALRKFIEENENLTQNDLNELLKTKFFKFKFLRKVNAVLSNMLEMLKDHGAYYVACRYSYSKNINRELDRVLP